MKNRFVIFASILLLGFLSVFSSCSTEQPTHGILVVTVMDSHGNLIPFEEVFIATSYQNLQNGNYLISGWTDENGEILFMDLLPGTYWYDTRNWEDYGASQVWAGIEHYVILWVNTPAAIKGIDKTYVHVSIKFDFQIS